MRNLDGKRKEDGCQALTLYIGIVFEAVNNEHSTINYHKSLNRISNIHYKNNIKDLSKTINYSIDIIKIGLKKVTW